MKQLIVPIAIIVALIAFFVIIDRKDFKRYDDVQTVSVSETKHVTNVKPMAETTPAERKSIVETMPVAETKPVTEAKPEIEATPKTDAKPAETKPTTEAKSATEASPITEAKPAKTKPTDTKPATVPVATAEEANRANEDALKLLPKEGKKAPSKGTKSVAEIKTENKLVPVAVPVLTPEEAIKANKEAIRFQRNKEIAKAFQPFIHKIGLNNNRIHFILSLLPLLFVFDVLLFKRKKQRNSKMLEYISLPRRIRILFSVSLFAFGILVFVPWSVYFGNTLQFPFIFQDFVNWNLSVLTISIIVACIILLLIPPVVSDYLVAIIAGLGLSVYVQAMFMNQHLGTMDGIEPIWSEHRVFGTINLIVWIAIVLSPVVLRKLVPSYFSKVISMATGVVLLLEVLASASMVFSAAQDVWTRTDTYFADGSKQFQLSKKKNVVVFVFDTLGSEYVERCFETYPEAKEIVKDFTWYKEARANYHMTFPGLIHEYTGAMLPAPAKSYYELHEKMWHSPSAKSFFKQINDAGYDARLYSPVGKFEIGPEDNFHEYFSNIEARAITYEIDYRHLHHCLREMSGFSSIPYFFKKYFFYAFDFSDDVVQKVVADIPSDKKWIPIDNPGILKKMTASSGLTTSADKPTLSFYYSTGAHKPWRLDEKCNRVDEPYDNPCPTSRSCFHVLSEFIRLIKDANIYDNTAILICSDHGGNDTGGGNGKYDLTFMIKPFHENKAELSIDEAKVLSIDILPTLLYLACGEKADFNNFEGYTPNNVPSERVRKVYRFWHNKSLPPPDPDLDKCYPGCVGLEEYVFDDLKTFKLGQKSESFVRLIPLIMSPEENKENK